LAWESTCSFKNDIALIGSFSFPKKLRAAKSIVPRGDCFSLCRNCDAASANGPRAMPKLRRTQKMLGVSQFAQGNRDATGKELSNEKH
jgi:hypothetical protein